jgi:hypothetical protein
MKKTRSRKSRDTVPLTASQEDNKAVQNNNAKKVFPRKKQRHAERKIHLQADIMYRNACKKRYTEADIQKVSRQTDKDRTQL